MEQIEEAIHAVHAEAIAEKQRNEEEKKLLATSEETSSSSPSQNAAASAPASTSTAPGTSTEDSTGALKPFAKVNMVAPDSPAREAVRAQVAECERFDLFFSLILLFYFFYGAGPPST